VQALSSFAGDLIDELSEWLVAGHDQ